MVGFNADVGPDSNTAIIVIDFQNEFIRADGKLHGDVKEVMEETGMLQKIPHVVRAARDTGAIVIHSPVVMETGTKFKDEDWDPNSYGAMENLFMKGTWNCEFADEVKPQGADVILQNRVNFSAFRGTQLKDVIASKGINRLFVMGLLSNVCVEETSREASELFPDLNIYVCRDGCAAKTKQDHYIAMGSSIPVYANIITCDEAQGMLRMSTPSGGHGQGQEEAGALLPRPHVEFTYRPRLLALHGAQSNKDVTELQLQNLNITEEDYDIVYLNGGVQVEEPHPSLEGLVPGPYYSWYDENDQASVVKAVQDVVKACRDHGPFDGIYGFSYGAVVATLVANLSRDPSLQELLANAPSPRGRFSVIAAGTRRQSTVAAGSRRQLNKESSSRRGLNRKSSSRKVAGNRRGSVFGKAPEPDVSEPLFRFVILACAAPSVSFVRKMGGIKKDIETGTIPVSSFHIIAIEDDFKANSEIICSLYANKHVKYISGGHSVSREVRSDKDLSESLRKFARTLGRPSTRGKAMKYVDMNEVSAMHLLTDKQIAFVQLKHELLPEGKYSDGATIRGALKAQPAEAPFLNIARNTDDKSSTSYGDILKFIDGGEGDLRALGVAPGEVVSYAAPPGGSAIAALAFLSIGAQTSAAPLAPGTAEPDALDALAQFNAKHLILFEGVDCPGVEAAFQKFVSDGKAILHRAVPLGNDKPGMFEYKVDAKDKEFGGKRPLVNKEDDICLLLRTSGTTARPKGVPLSQGSLITNGAIIAKAMQLTESDVCYSVMPLFHIGGLSASILCTLTSGGAVSCDGEPFDPGRMVEALGLSRPQPTWYSSVPTIHNATVNFLKQYGASDEKYINMGVDKDGIWAKGHSLRMIRSGAAALLGPDGKALAAAYGGVPIYPTYSMSEQMPISQPPAGKVDTMTTKPGSVGMPVAASTAIVSRANLRPQPPGVEGEIAISGPTVLKNYLSNPSADAKNYFYLTLPENKSSLPYFLTGDVGVIDSDGFLSLKGRAKELIKKGGEQVSPFEVEEPLLEHPWIQSPVAFAVPSQMYGEEVGCALILAPTCPVRKDDPGALQTVSKEMRSWLKEAKIAPVKWPTKWILVSDDELPKTKTKKYIRIGLSTHLGMDPKEEDSNDVAKKQTTAKVDWAVISGFRFVLACYVMFMHIGSNKSWGSWNNLRGWPWHVHVFFTLGGYSMASPMNPTIGKKFTYFLARIGSMYPMYSVALFFGLINLLIVCRPSTFRPVFNWDGQPDDMYLEDGSLAPLFCEGTWATPNSYWGSLFLTIFTYIFGLAVTPFWPINWWLGYYLWFSSMYYCCLACFPATYNYFFNNTRKNVGLLLRWVIGLLVVNAGIITAGWFIFKDMTGYGHYDDDGNKVSKEQYTNGQAQNGAVLGFYLFGPFWQLYFVVGIAAAFLYDAHRPAEKHSARNWGWCADFITLFMIGMSIAMINQGVQDYGEYPEEKFMRPSEADQFIDSAVSNRLWDNLVGRIMAPLTTLWIYALSTGEGFTAAALRTRILSQTLAPNAYNCFLFHQMIGQWYYAATRNGTMWNWWRFRKGFYWFSPGPCPVEWYEYFYVVGLVVCFSNLMTTLQPIVSDGLSNIKGLIFEEEEGDDEDTAKLLSEVIEGMTGIEPMMDFTLEECGLASIGVPVLVGLLNKNFSTKKRKLTIAAADLVSAKTIGDMVEVVDDAKARADDQGV